MSNNNQPQYKRGTIIKNGKRYGFYPDGSLYRIYSTSDRPFLEIVDIEGKTFLRIRQATEQGYTDCPAPGAAVAHVMEQRTQQLTLLQRSVKMASPDRILAMGFSITQHNGKAVRNGQTLCKGDEIITTFAHGQVKSVVK